MTDANLNMELLHEFAREVVVRMKSYGVIFDKKMLRFNEIVAVGLNWSRMGFVPSDGIARAGIMDAINACVKFNPHQITWNYHADREAFGPFFGRDYIPGRGPETMIQKWMEKPHD